MTLVHQHSTSQRAVGGFDFRQQSEMAHPLTGISKRDREATPPSIQTMVEQFSAQLIALTARVGQLEEQKGLSYRNSFKHWDYPDSVDRREGSSGISVRVLMDTCS